MNTVEDYAIRLAKVLIYRQNIKSCEFPDEMERLLDAYLESGETEYEETIETQYEADIIKKASFQAGSMYGEMNTLGGRIRQFCIGHHLGWIYTKPIITILLIAILVFIFNSCFRYKYTVYKGKIPYSAEVIKVDRLTGTAEMVIIRPSDLKK